MYKTVGRGFYSALHGDMGSHSLGYHVQGLHDTFVPSYLKRSSVKPGSVALATENCNEN